jgi:hypothetical protein
MRNHGPTSHWKSYAIYSHILELDLADQSYGREALVGKSSDNIVRCVFEDIARNY